MHNIKRKDGEVPLPKPSKRASGWCKGAGREPDGRPGADFLKELVGKYGSARNSSLKCPVFAGNSGGTAEMFCFALRVFALRAFII